MYEVDEYEVLTGQNEKPFEDRLTKFNCKRCQKPLSVRELSSIRLNFAPCMHYECFLSKE